MKEGYIVTAGIKCFPNCILHVLVIISDALDDGRLYKAVKLMEDIDPNEVFALISMDRDLF
jgi:hypothetical protein